jgi:hypothetical protein
MHAVVVSVHLDLLNPALRNASFGRGTLLPACTDGGIYVIVKPITGTLKKRSARRGISVTAAPLRCRTNQANGGHHVAPH